MVKDHPMRLGDDDSTGKAKIGPLKQRNQLLLALFALGVCVGVIAS